MVSENDLLSMKPKAHYVFANVFVKEGHRKNNRDVSITLIHT